MRTFASAILLTIFGASAHAQSLQLDGKFGYLGEYELTAEVAAPASGANKEFSGRYDRAARRPLQSRRAE